MYSDSSKIVNILDSLTLLSDEIRDYAKRLEFVGTDEIQKRYTLCVRKKYDSVGNRGLFSRVRHV